MMIILAWENSRKYPDNLSKMKETYAALAIEPDHTRYGWMRVGAG